MRWNPSGLEVNTCSLHPSFLSSNIRSAVTGLSDLATYTSTQTIICISKHGFTSWLWIKAVFQIAITGRATQSCTILHISKLAISVKHMISIALKAHSAEFLCFKIISNVILFIWQFASLFVLLLKTTCKNNYVYFTDIKKQQKHVPRMNFFSRVT